jgi:hypothetical protein
MTSQPGAGGGRRVPGTSYASWDAVGEPLTSAKDEQRMRVALALILVAVGSVVSCWRAIEPSLVAKREKRL